MLFYMLSTLQLFQTHNTNLVGNVKKFEQVRFNFTKGNVFKSIVVETVFQYVVVNDYTELLI